MQMLWATSFGGSLQLDKARVICDNKCPHFGQQKKTLVLYLTKKMSARSHNTQSCLVLLFIPVSDANASLFIWIVFILSSVFCSGQRYRHEVSRRT